MALLKKYFGEGLEIETGTVTKGSRSSNLQIKAKKTPWASFFLLLSASAAARRAPE